MMPNYAPAVSFRNGTWLLTQEIELDNDIYQDWTVPVNAKQYKADMAELAELRLKVQDLVQMVNHDFSDDSLSEKLRCVISDLLEQMEAMRTQLHDTQAELETLRAKESARVKYPRPMMEAPALDTEYWTIPGYRFDKVRWQNGPWDYGPLGDGRAFATRNEARQAIVAIRDFINEAMESKS